MITDYLKNAVGPAPWYWKRFPKLQGKSNTYSWVNGGHSAIYLINNSKPDEIRFAVRMYTRVFPINSRLFGIWYEEKDRIVVSAYDPDSIEFVLNSKVDPDSETYDCYKQTLASFSLRNDLEEGAHPASIPDCFLDIPEIFIVAPLYSIYAVNTEKGLIRVHPQKWFTASDYDFGYQWITAVTRNPDTGRLIGEGIRLDPFILTPDGCHIDQWLGKDWEIMRPH